MLQSKGFAFVLQITKSYVLNGYLGKMKFAEPNLNNVLLIFNK